MSRFKHAAVTLTGHFINRIADPLAPTKTLTPMPLYAMMGAS